MNKAEFLDALRSSLSQLPGDEIEKSLSFYSEAVDDRIEDGMTEEEAVADLGDVHDIAQEILLDTPLPVLMKTRVSPGRRLKTFEIVLLILGFPIWFPLLIAFGAVALVLYLCVWIIIASLCIVVISFGIAAIGAVVIGILRSPLNAIGLLAMIGTGFVGAGLCILSCFPVKYAINELIRITAKVARWCKSIFIKKEVV